jgi:hypothetical protein
MKKTVIALTTALAFTSAFAASELTTSAGTPVVSKDNTPVSIEAPEAGGADAAPAAEKKVAKKKAVKKKKVKKATKPAEKPAATPAPAATTAPAAPAHGH